MSFTASKHGRRTCANCKKYSRTTGDKCLWCGKSLTIKEESK